ncbi:UNVERIFIED_CONTAM: putative disease resistance protein [Sesamum radiatum]|uniref:Disease resistance protein n=1 Tax=Sesamum radiatum TaxID=300843 RepID=A0AAW2K8T3_SESRA
MAEAAVSFAVETLGNLAIQKVAFLQGVEGQVNWLKDELKRMQSFLKDAAEKQINNVSIRDWISEIRELAQDAEDVINSFILKVETPRRSRGLLGRCACFPEHVYHLDQLGQEIENIRDRLQAIESSRKRYGIEDLGGGTTLLMPRRSEVVEKRQLSPWQRDKDVVGLEEDVEQILQRAVVQEWEDLSVATIVGMGGLGKSTLAREVYNHPDLVARFECRAWVVVSREFNPKEIMKSLMLQLVEQQKQREILEIMEKSDLQNIMHMLHQQLMGKRFFIVLDDIWQEEAWESLSGAFPCQDRASRLLLTSRNRDIPKHARYVHDLQLLDPDKSWQLFLKKAFINNTDGKCPKDLENIGREILRKCNGLPLAITVVGGVLVKQRQSESEWERVLNGLNSHLGRSGSSVSAILELSYQDLPPQLKSCFLCLGFFKEDAVIRVTKLVNLWIAEGLVSQEGEETEMLEEIARSYLDELINRNMVQVKEWGKFDRVKNCYVHDLLRKLSITKAKEEINFEILRQGKSQHLDKPRHRAIYCGTESFIHSPSTRLRSLFVHGAGKVYDSPSYWKSFGLLKVLDFEDFDLKNLPDTIGALTLLRYLGLRNTKIKELPSSLGRLKNLEVLDIAKNNGMEVPDILWKMASLRHLYMSEIRCQLPLRIDTLNNLQTLTWVPADSCTLEHLPHMTSLRKLGIELRINSDVGKLCTALAVLENLVCLKLRGPDSLCTPSLDRLSLLHSLTQLKLDVFMTKLPDATNFPPNLSYLSLHGTLLEEDPMPVLQELPKLLYLKMFDAYYGEVMEISQKGFPKLKLLSLHCLLELRNIEVGRGAMPELKRLEIYKCPHLESLPKELRFMTSLQELKMVTTTEIVSKLQGVDSHTISSIPSLNLVGLSYHSCFVISKRRFIDGVSRWIKSTVEEVNAATSGASSSADGVRKGETFQPVPHSRASSSEQDQDKISEAELMELINKLERAHNSGASSGTPGDQNGASFVSELLEQFIKKRNAPRSKHLG